MVQFELIAGSELVADGVRQYHKWKTRHLRIVSRAEIFRAIMTQLDRPEWENFRMYAIMCYLTGSRLNEVMNIKRKDCEKRVFRCGDKDYNVLLITLINLKNRDIATKQIPLVYGIDPTDDSMIDILNIYLAKFKDDDLIFKRYAMKTTIYDHYLSKLKFQVDYREPRWPINDMLTIRFNCFPHYLRHARATHLGSISNRAMTNQMGWKGDSVLEDTYVHRQWEIIAKQRVLNNV